ncbi:MAG: SRPBCC family protein [Pseudomonadota bacterium]
MTTIQLSQRIPATPQAVYDYVTRPARWKQWHPASLGAQDHADTSLTQGATFEEDIRSAGFTRHLRWIVKDSQPGIRWEAHAVMDDGSTVQLLYEFAADGTGMRFTRTLNYSVKPLLLRWANDLVMWRKVRRESGKAMANLAARFGD